MQNFIHKISQFSILLLVMFYYLNPSICLDTRQEYIAYKERQFYWNNPDLIKPLDNAIARMFGSWAVSSKHIYFYCVERRWDEHESYQQCFENQHHYYMKNFREFIMVMPFTTQLYMPRFADEESSQEAFREENRLQYSLDRYRRNKEINIYDFNNICSSRFMGNANNDCLDLKIDYPVRHKASKAENIVHDIRNLLRAAVISGKIDDYAKLAPYLIYPFKFNLKHDYYKEKCIIEANNLEEFAHYFNFFVFNAQAGTYLKDADYNVEYGKDGELNFRSYERDYALYGDSDGLVTMYPPMSHLKVSCTEHIKYPLSDDCNYFNYYHKNYRYEEEDNVLSENERLCANPTVTLYKAEMILKDSIEETENITVVLDKLMHKFISYDGLSELIK